MQSDPNILQIDNLSKYFGGLAAVSNCSLKIKRGDFTWWRNHIFRLESNWRYEGVLHEYATCDAGAAMVCLKLGGNYHIEARTLGARNLHQTPVEKYTKDAIMLEEALIDDPNNSRYQFYLAQSYFDSQQWEKSLEAYEKLHLKAVCGTTRHFLMEQYLNHLLKFFCLLCYIRNNFSSHLKKKFYVQILY